MNSSKLKIGIVTHTFSPEFGAAPSRLADMAKGLSKAGYQVEVFTGFPNYPLGQIHPAYKKKFYLKEGQDGYQVFRHWIYPIKSNSKKHRLANMLSIAISIFTSLPHLIRNKPDVIIVQYPPVLLPFSAWFIAKLANAKFVVNVSDLWPSAIADLGVLKKKWLFKVLYSMEKFMYTNADFCLGQSEEIIDYIQRSGQKHTLLYRTGADINLFTPSLKENEPDPIIRKKRLLYIGVLGLAHNVLQLVKEIDFEKLNVEFHIFGDGFERKNIETYIAKHSLKSVFIHTPISQVEVAEKLKEFDFSLVCQKTYVKGTLPSKLYEAMAAGIPILFHGAGEGAKIVEEAKCGLVSAPDGFQQLEKNILSLRDESSSSLMELGIRGRKIAAKKFDRTLQIEKLVALLNNMEEDNSLSKPTKKAFH